MQILFRSLAAVVVVMASLLARGDEESDAATQPGLWDLHLSRGLLLELRHEEPRLVAPPDKEKFEVATMNFGSKKEPKFQWIIGAWKWKAMEEEKPTEPFPAGQPMFLLKTAWDEKQGDSARSLVVCLFYPVAEEREQEEKWKKGILGEELRFQLLEGKLNPDIHGRVEHEEWFNHQTVVPRHHWSVLLLEDHPVIYIEPLSVMTPVKDGKSKSDKKEPEPDLKVKVWIRKPAPLTTPPPEKAKK